MRNSVPGRVVPNDKRRYMAKLTLGLAVAWFLGAGSVHAEIPTSSPQPGHGTSILRVLGARKLAVERLPGTESESDEVWIFSLGAPDDGLPATGTATTDPSERRDSGALGSEADRRLKVAVPVEIPRDKAISSRQPGSSSRHPAFRDPEVEKVDFRQDVTTDGQMSSTTTGATTHLRLGRELGGPPAVLPRDDVTRSQSSSARSAMISVADTRTGSAAPGILVSPASGDGDELEDEDEKDVSTRLGPFEVVDHTEELTVVYRRSKLLRTDVDVYRTAVVDPTVCDVIQYTPREISVIGLGQGATHVTFWFDDDSYRPVTYLVRVVPDPEVQERREEQYALLEEHLGELFPESKVQLLVMADKLIVRGQARDAEEAAQILAVIRGQAVRARDILAGAAASPLARDETNRTSVAVQVINMLRIPGPHQVALRVKIAELDRSAARQFGVGLEMNFSQGELLLRSLLNAASGGSATILGSFDGGDINFGIRYLEQHGVVRMLSEPTLVTLSGHPATFIAGGEFAVPTTVGVAGAAAVTTDFRAFGAIITFLPVVLDKDNIRLEVAPEFSRINSDNEVNGTPGLDTRAVTTTVQMREGQTLVIAGLLDDSMKADNQGDLPWVSQIFGRRSVSRNETELIILVTPELVHPMDPEEVPPLPGFDVTEPNNYEFFLKGHIEGRPTHEYRSTVWPRLRRRYQAGGLEMISGPFGHGE